MIENPSELLVSTCKQLQKANVDSSVETVLNLLSSVFVDGSSFDAAFDSISLSSSHAWAYWKLVR